MKNLKELIKQVQQQRKETRKLELVVHILLEMERAGGGCATEDELKALTVDELLDMIVHNCMDIRLS